MTIRQSIKIVVILVIVVLGIGGYFIFTKKGTETKVFATKEQCEQESVSGCIYYLCDIPIGDLYQKLCIREHGTGWYSSSEIGAEQLAPPQAPTYSPQPNTEVDDINNKQITNWKTYRNEKYGFEFKYPESAQVERDEMTDEVTFHGLGIRLSPVNKSPIEVFGSTLCKKSETIMMDLRKASRAECEIEDRKYIIVVVNIDHPIFHLLSVEFITNSDSYNQANSISDEERTLQVQALRNFNQILFTFKFIR